MIEVFWPVGLFLLLAFFGLPAAFSLMIAGLAGVLVGMPPARALDLMGSVVGSMLPYAVVGMLILGLLGSWLQGLGAVQTFPDNRLGTPRDPDRESWFSASAMGAPLPIAVPLVLACFLMEISIGKAVLVALPVGLLLTLIYVILFVILMARGRPASVRRSAVRVDVALVVFRILIPILAIAVVFVPVHLGLVTPNEAFAVFFVLLLIPGLLCAALSRGGWRRSGMGLLAGARGAGNMVLLILGFALLATVLQQSGGLGKIYEPLELPPTIAVPGVLLVVLIVGMVTGPLAALGIVVIVGYPLIASAGVDPVLFAGALFIAVEAVRVGPRLWRDGFLRGRILHEDGTVEVETGSWPYYLAAVPVTLVYGWLIADPGWMPAFMSKFM